MKNLYEKQKGCHAWDHTIRVYRLCMHIGKIEGVDLKVLKYASLLHDIGRKYQDKTGGKICHAAKGAELAEGILKKYGFTRDIIEQITHCIRTHRFRGKLRPLSREAQVLFDSDKLDSIGAVGIGRAFLFAGEVGAKLHNRGVDIEKTKPYTKEDTAYREYMVKLRKVRDRIITKEGNRLAEERHEYMVEFFKRFDKEVEGGL